MQDQELPHQIVHCNEKYFSLFHDECRKRKRELKQWQKKEKKVSAILSMVKDFVYLTSSLS
jgi:hypothetical protein